MPPPPPQQGGEPPPRPQDPRRPETSPAASSGRDRCSRHTVVATSAAHLQSPSKDHIPQAQCSLLPAMAGSPEQEAIADGTSAAPLIGGSGGSTENTRSNNGRVDGSLPQRPPPPLSCTKCFDTLWFCYSPVHQMQQYYRRGEFDNCIEKWNTLFDCLKLKTKKSSEVQEILEARENARPHIWTFRTVEEASAHWKKAFGSMAADRGAGASS